MRLNRLRNRLKSRSNPKRRTETSNARKKRAARTDTHDAAGTQSPTTDTGVGARGAAGSGNANASATAGTAGLVTASRRIGVGLVIEWRIRADRRPTRPRSAWTAQPPGACLRRQRARCADRRRPRGDLSVASRPRHRRGRAGRQPAAGRYVTAREHAGRHAGPAGPTPTVVPPSSLPAGSSTQVPLPRRRRTGQRACRRSRHARAAGCDHRDEPGSVAVGQLWHRARRQPRFVGTRRQRAAVGSGRHTGDRADTRTEGAVGGRDCRRRRHRANGRVAAAAAEGAGNRAGAFQRAAMGRRLRERRAARCGRRCAPYR